jgi:hypothetical protein
MLFTFFLSFFPAFFMSVVVVNPTSQPVPVVGNVAVTSFSTPEKVTDVNAGTELSLIPTSLGSVSNHEFACAFSLQLTMSAAAVRFNYPLTVPLDTSVVYLASVVQFSLTYVSGTLPSGALGLQLTTVTSSPNVAGSAYGFAFYNNVSAYNGPILVLPIPSLAGSSNYNSLGLNANFEFQAAPTTPYPAIQGVYTSTAACVMSLQLVVILHPIS